MYHSPERDGLRADRPNAGLQRLSRGRLLTLGAAGAVAACTPLERAFAAWNASLPKTLQGTVSFCQNLYESVPAYDASNEKQPGRLYKKYLQAHPGVQLQMVREPTANAQAWFLTRAIANRLPDLLGVPVPAWPYIQRGFFVPITKYLMKPNPYIPGNKRWIDTFPKDFLKPYLGPDGNYYGISADTNCTWFYYNPDHLAGIGMKPPATWAALMEACAKLHAKGITPYSQYGGVFWINSDYFIVAESAVWASEFPPGTTLSISDWVRAVKKGLLKHTDARSRAAWQLMKQFSTYWARGAVSTGDVSVYNHFANGEFTFLMDGSWQIGTLHSVLKGKFPLSVLPNGWPPITKASLHDANGSLQGGGSGALSGTQLWVTKHAADHLDLVVDFLQYFSSPQVIGPMALEVGSAPVVKGISDLPPLLAESVSVASQPGLLQIPYQSADPEYAATYDKMAEGYIAGALSLDTALSQLEAAQQAAVNRLAAQMHL